MALSLSYFFIYFALIFCTLTEAATRVYNFTAEWVRANPDGLFERPVIGINGQWPIPRIEATVGDRLVVNLYNNLGNQSTSIHFHGLFMNGTTHMDGVVGATQCGVPPGASFTYNFTVWLNFFKAWPRILTLCRSANQVPTGIILIWMGSTLTASEGH
jgi:iron transport multicopper oxidase